MLKLKGHYFGNLMQKADSYEKALMLGKIEDGRINEVTEEMMSGWHH